MAKMKAVQVPKPGADFEIVEREIPQPGTGQVRIRVQACGICHSDSVVKENLLPGITYPRVPGHEVAGVIDEVGGGVTTWKKGQRVGVGWHGGQAGPWRVPVASTMKCSTRSVALNLWRFVTSWFIRRPAPLTT
jgi:D-arabinose 1-dehydrogenase-like Zn-dependent alcohol dehydrogenase